MLQNNKPEILINSISDILNNYLHERRLYILPRAHYYYVENTMIQLDSIKQDHYPFKIVRVLYLTKKLHDYLLKYQSLSLLPKINHFIFGMLTACRIEPCILEDNKINNELQVTIDTMLVKEITKLLEMICLEVLEETKTERTIQAQEKDNYLMHTFVDSDRIKSIGFKNKEDLLLDLSANLREQMHLFYNAEGLLFQRFAKIILSCEGYGLTLLNLDKSLTLISKAKNKLVFKETLVLGKVLVKGFDDPFILKNKCEITDEYHVTYDLVTLGLIQHYYAMTRRTNDLRMACKS